MMDCHLGIKVLLFTFQHQHLGPLSFCMMEKTWYLFQTLLSQSAFSMILVSFVCQGSVLILIGETLFCAVLSCALITYFFQPTHSHQLKIPIRGRICQNMHAAAKQLWVMNVPVNVSKIKQIRQHLLYNFITTVTS